jgi:DNA-binding transcriptional MerR regulator
MSVAEMQSAGGKGYRIGTVAGLTGLDPHTIRAWERRHRAVEPCRSERGTRLYDDASIERLQLLKALVDCGEPIRSIAALPDEQLRERLAQLAGLSLHGERRRTRPGPAPSLALLSPTLEAQIRSNPRGLPGFRVVASCDRPEALVERLRRKPCDLLVLELEQLGSEPLAALDVCLVAGAVRQIAVVYTFARRALLTRLARRGVRLVRGPLGLEQLHRALSDLVTIARATERSRPSLVPVTEDGEPAPRRFDDAQLARICEVSTAIECECPHHLSTLIRGLVAFEAYSSGCESRDAEDAAMHRRLARQTARARSVMEELLACLCEFEGIEA